MAIKVLKRVNEKVKFFYRQNEYLTTRLKRLLSGALIQPHFDDRCTLWCPLLNKNIKHKLQVGQNKCIRLGLGLCPHSSIGAIHLRKINWLPISERVKSCIAVTLFKYWNVIVPSHINMFKLSYNRYNTRSQMALDKPLRKRKTGH